MYIWYLCYSNIVLDNACYFQAEDFNESVQVIREWLPQVEAELKFRSLPDNEEAIVQRIEQHDVSSSSLHVIQSNPLYVNI